LEQLVRRHLRRDEDRVGAPRKSSCRSSPATKERSTPTNLTLGSYDAEAVQLADAVMFASGATHIEIGDDRGRSRVDELSGLLRTNSNSCPPEFLAPA
jgi:hypothetical protein